jgi:hypothetical protein
MCREHWFQVPAALRKAVWLTWNEGLGAGGKAHDAAMAAAVGALRRQS